MTSNAHIVLQKEREEAEGKHVCDGYRARKGQEQLDRFLQGLEVAV